MEGRGRRIASNGLAVAVGLLLLAAVVSLTVAIAHRPKSAIPKVTVGTRDEVYYSHAATREDAAALGSMLQRLGYFGDRGGTVLLSRNAGGTVVSFVVQEGFWNSAAAASSFEEIGRRVANATSGFPIEVRLVDSAWQVHKAMQVGKVKVGSKDEIYYLGSATAEDAKALGLALRSTGYLKDLGVSVEIEKGEATVIGFVVGEGVWQQPQAVAEFASLARKVAPAVGELPIEVRLLSPQMEAKTAVQIR